jgi:hypothetical protein
MGGISYNGKAFYSTYRNHAKSENLLHTDHPKGEVSTLNAP